MSTQQQLQPLRERAAQLYAAAKQKTQAEQERWVQSEKPALKHYAKGLKETLELQNQAVDAQQARVRNLSAAGTEAAQERVHSGFNVIRARVTSDGKSWPTADLRAEHERLTNALNQLAIDIAAAKAEIKSQRRAEEVEIWETQLVALQDTMRVYRQEINIIEVELLGREQQERIEAERAMAEASGQAQLQRLQDQALQTRVRFNRAKQQYHFPPPFGYNITFGGGGIYGGIKDITLTEVHGSASVTGSVLSGPSRSSSGGADPSSEPRARLVIEFGVPNSPLGGLGGTSSRAASQPSTPGRAQRRETASAAANGHPAQHGSPAKLAAGGSTRRAAMTGQPASPSRKSSSGSSSFRGGGEGQPPAQQQQQQPVAVVARKPSKAKAMAVRFLNKLGSKKEKYQGKEQPQLQPQEQPAEQGARRTLASKLMHRKSSRLADPGSPQLSRGLGDSIEFSMHGSSEPLGDATGLGSLAEFPGYSDSLGDGSEDLLAEVDEVEEDAVAAAAAAADQGRGHLFASSQRSLVADDGGGSGGRPLVSPLTKEALQHAAEAPASDDDASSSSSDEEGEGDPQLQRRPAARLPPAFERGSWLRGRGSSGVEGTSTWGGESSLTGGASDLGADAGDAAAAAAAAAAASSSSSGRRGVHVVGRVTGFGLVGERGSKVPNLSLAQGDVEGHVFVRFVFEYTKLGGWQPAERPQFDVTHLRTRLRGNNVPFPDALIKTILRMAIPGLIQRKLLGVVPKELGSYLLSANQGFHVNADVALVAAPLSVLDADLSFEVKGPAKSAAEAKKQQLKYAAAKEARRLLGLSLPQAQVLAELFRPKTGVLELPHAVSIFQLIALQRSFDRQPQLYGQLCQALNTGYQLLAERGRVDVGDFSFPALMDGPVSRMRRKPSRIRVITHNVDVPVNLDALLTAVRDYTQRALEELLIKGPVANPRDNPEFYEDDVPLEEQLEVLHAWHAWMLQELSHFKGKFQGAGGTLLGAASTRGFSAGVENAFYEGPLRLRVPVSMQLDSDGAFSFDVPLPSPEGAIGEFVDGIKSRLVPSHLRPPAMAVNWIPPTGDTEVDEQMQAQVTDALQLIQRVLDTLGDKVSTQGAEKMDEDPVTALSQPRTLVGDRLGRMIVNRLRVHVRLDERRISEILQGIDARSMGAGFLATAGRILGHLGDVMTLGFTPAVAGPGGNVGGAGNVAADVQQYLLQFESSDISRLRADVQSLGFQSFITPGGAVRLVHACIRSFLSAFKGVAPGYLKALDERFQVWYQHMTRESLDVSVCLDLKGTVQGGSCVVTLSGTAEEVMLRETSPFVGVNDLELLPCAVSMWGPGAATAAAERERRAAAAGS